jgi:hypothetical protein
MKTAEFNKNFEISKTSKRGIRANPKTADALPKPEIETADGEIYDAGKVYFFFDESTRKVRSSTGLRQIENIYLGTFGLRVVEIGKLRNSKDAALSDGQDFFRNRIGELNEMIEAFEAEKTCGSKKTVAQPFSENGS